MYPAKVIAGKSFVPNAQVQFIEALWAAKAYVTEHNDACTTVSGAGFCSTTNGATGGIIGAFFALQKCYSQPTICFLLYAQSLCCCQ
jgi:hypothetical protein